MKIALGLDWRDAEDSGPDPAAIVRAFTGRVRHAEYRAGSDVLVLEYEDGRTVSVTLAQCRTHTCDNTLMIVDDGRTTT